MKHKFDIRETVVDWTIPEIPRTGFRSATPLSANHGEDP